MQMECLLQYLDDLDDLYGMLALQAERLRALLVTLLSVFVCAGVALAAAVLARQHPPLALGACCLLAVSLLYRAATGIGAERQSATALQGG